ncbi:MAG: S-methyl-5-thioribose-1-phosphate isomerase, partial [Candidatus Omnitrophica bacterium]|nr:S-methyl-5-thioribose-1-phosphate isomerase [Candidatus Omnitrophota bacterium]
KVRGAPAIGIAAAYGVYLGIRGSRARAFGSFDKEVGKTARYLAGARPTARNLFWALERVCAVLEKNRAKSVGALKKIILQEAHAILKEDKRICREIGKRGRTLFHKGTKVLTHCNAGGLATSGYGTALGVIFSAGKDIACVYVDETRPVLQGARLTVWELLKKGINTTLICDNSAASLMAKKEIDAVIVGADRIAANGDTANKTGTYGLAVLASYHDVPFYAAAPVSTFDLSVPDGAAIPIEQRDPSEVRKINGRLITVRGVNALNPAFDVTPAGLITAIITERGIITRPDRRKIAKVVRAA